MSVLVNALRHVRQRGYEVHVVLTYEDRRAVEALGAHGFNIGINVGKVAGAAVDEHVHTHIVPRWEGDTNFMPVVAETKVLPEALASVYGKLRGKLAQGRY